MNPDVLSRRMHSQEVDQARRILVVEDHVGLRELIDAVLTDAGYEVVTAATADEALRIADEKPVDVLLTDLGLPGLNGNDLARRFQEQSQNLPVVLMSGRDPEDLEACRSDAHFLPKPFTPKSLLAVVSKSLEKP